MAPHFSKDKLWSEVEREHARAQQQLAPDADTDVPSAPGRPSPEAPSSSAVAESAPVEQTDGNAQASPSSPNVDAETGSPARQIDAAAVIERLAAITQLDYARARREHARALGVQVRVLDDLVKAARDRDAAADQVLFTDDEPSQEPVDAAELLDDIERTLHRHVALGTEQADAATLWTVCTHLSECFDFAPILAITAAEPGSGKTTMQSVLARMCRRPLPAANVSPSALFRAVEKWGPTLFVDEGDTFLRNNAEMHNLLNAGHGRGLFVLRSEPKGDGFEPRAFKVFGLKCISGNALQRHLPSTTMSRCILIHLNRKLASERTERLRDADPATFERQRSKIARFKVDYAPRLYAARPRLPDELSDRAQDNWAPLFAIAECAGPAWLERAKRAAIKLSGATESRVSLGNELLGDIRRVFDTTGRDRISTEELIRALCEDAERPWAHYDHGKPITPRQLARLLDPYSIKSKTVRMGEKKTPKGFERSQFHDAFARYLKQVPTLPEQGSGVREVSQAPARSDVADADDGPPELDSDALI